MILLGIALLTTHVVPPANGEPWSPAWYGFCMPTHDAKRRSLPEQAQMLRELGFDGIAYSQWFEVSSGPFLADNNVIVGTRDAAGDAWGEGICSHDGNGALYTHNLIIGCAGHGVRLRNLFDRVADGKPTTTSDNRVWNNLFIDNQRGGVSLNSCNSGRRTRHRWTEAGPIWVSCRPTTCCPPSSQPVDRQPQGACLTTRKTRKQDKKADALILDPSSPS